jgi:hypothetical protein
MAQNYGSERFSGELVRIAALRYGSELVWSVELHHMRHVRVGEAAGSNRFP